jgi:hypothetical protein
MNDTIVHVPVGDGEVAMPLLQALAIAQCCQDFTDPVWHFNECGCCVSVHERGDTGSGYIVGNDGTYDWVTVAEHDK